MTTPHLIAALACTGQLVLALVAVLRGAGGPLTLPLALLCLDVFTWSGADLAAELTGRAAWHWLDVSTSPLTTPLALDFVLAFVGQRRRRRWLRAVSWSAFGLLALASALGALLPAVRGFGGSDLWAALHLGGAVPAMAFAVALIVAHLRATADAEEKARARLVLAAFAIGAALSSTDLWGHFFPWLPSFGAIGLLAATSLLTVAATHLRLLERRPSPRTLALSLALAASSVLAYLALFRLVAGNAALLVFGAATLSLALMAATRQLAAASAARQARAARLSLLGRFSAQMAHDLKNPLAALKGAAQYLQEQLAREGAPAERRDFVQLILDQADRLHSVVEHYQRLSQVQPVRAPVALDQLVREVLALQPFAAGGKVALRTELAGGLPALAADRELLAEALENLVANAFEAMPEGGTVTVRTAAARGALVLSVEDDGAGMDARTRERAFDEFFTTKAAGTGLGLPFVRRVAEAHGGSVSLAARPGRGTVVQLRLPLT